MFEQLKLITEQKLDYEINPNPVIIYTKESLIEKLKNIRELGWIPNARTGHNHGIKFRLRQDKLASLYSHVKEI